MYNIEESKIEIFDFLNRENIKFECEGFTSGCYWIDLIIKKKSYIIQLEPEGIGFSFFDPKDPGFGTIPDVRFSDFQTFSEKLNEILEK